MEKYLFIMTRVRHSLFPRIHVILRIFSAASMTVALTTVTPGTVERAFRKIGNLGNNFLLSPSYRR